MYKLHWLKDGLRAVKSLYLLTIVSESMCLTDCLDPYQDNIIPEILTRVEELSEDCDAKQLEGTWRLLLPLSQEIVACSTEGALLASI